MNIMEKLKAEREAAKKPEPEVSRAEVDALNVELDSQIKAEAKVETETGLHLSS